MSDETIELNGMTVIVKIVPTLTREGEAWSRRQPPTIILREPDAHDGEVLLHELLHVLLENDPEQRVLAMGSDICPQERLVQWLSGGLHAAGYRRVEATTHKGDDAEVGQ